MITFEAVKTFLTSKIGRRLTVIVIALLILCFFVICIAVQKNTILKQKEENSKHKEEIIRLELHNETLKKEIEFISEQEKFKNSFSNSSVMIDNLYNMEDLGIITKEEYETFNNISNNFYKYFSYKKRFKNSQKLQTVPTETVCAHFFRFNISFMQCKNKICKNAFIKTTRNIYYKTYYKQTGFNEKISGKHYKYREWQLWYNIQTGTNYYKYNK